MPKSCMIETMILTVRKTLHSEAIQIRSSEDEETVRAWLKASGVEGEANLEPLKELGAYFLRDHGSPIVYVTLPEDFERNFEPVEKKADPFKF